MRKTFDAILLEEGLISEDSDLARDAYSRSRFGEIKAGCVLFSFLEGLYLLDKNKLRVVNKRKREVGRATLIRKASSKDKNFLTKFFVFSDLRKKGYLVKTALKFGAEFRVYDKGKKPGQAHATWVVYPVKGDSFFSWQDFASKNRVAHSTKKKLLIALVDEEGDVTYYEIHWIRP